MLSQRERIVACAAAYYALMNGDYLFIKERCKRYKRRDSAKV